MIYHKLSGVLIIYIAIILLFNGISAYSSSSNIIEEKMEVIDDSEQKQTEETNLLKDINKINGFFTENRGQIDDPSVRYYIPGKGVWFTKSGLTIQLVSEGERERGRECERLYESRISHPDAHHPLPTTHHDLSNKDTSVVNFDFFDCNNINPIGVNQLPHKSNFFYGNDPDKWQPDVPNFQEILYLDLYDKIDLRYYTTSEGLKYDFIVHPGGDPEDIKINCGDLQKLELDNSGNILIKKSLGTISDSSIYIYQKDGYNQKSIAGKFKIISPTTYGFELLDDYNEEKDLIIDPLIYSTYMGGNHYDQSWAMEVDSNGDIYIAGGSDSDNFTTTQGVYNTTLNGDHYDFFVFKMDSNRSSLIYSTYIGGTQWDRGHDMEIDEEGNVYVTGATRSTDFPTTPNAYNNTFSGNEDVIVLKLNSEGSKLLYSTYVGGYSLDDGDAITIDSGGNAYVSGYTWSEDFPNTTGALDNSHNGGTSDTFIFKLDPNGTSIIYSTYIGGDGWDASNDIKVNQNGSVVLIGTTSSTNFPSTSNAYDNSSNGKSDCFLLLLSPNGSKLWYSTFLGSTEHDYLGSVEFDENDNIYLMGSTYSSDFVTTAGAYDRTANGEGDIVALKINLSSSQLIYSTYIGGSSQEWWGDLTIDNDGNAYITGYTQSTDFPVTNDAYDKSFNGGEGDVFVIKLNPTGSSILYSTYIGGSAFENGNIIYVSSSTDIIISGIVDSNNFPVTNNSIDTTFNGERDLFILKLRYKKNTIPEVLDLNISKSSVYRNHKVYLYSNATDLEDLEQELTPFFEYRDPNNVSWNKTHFSKPKYRKSHWEVSFTPSKDAVLGQYDFRVRFRDTGLLNSSWFYLNNSLLVSEKHPFFIAQNLTIELMMDRYEFYHGNEITGAVTVTNDNDFDIYTINPDLFNKNITLEPNFIFELDAVYSDNQYFSWVGGLERIKNHSSATFSFSLDIFGIKKEITKDRYIPPVGRYSVNLSFPIYINPDFYFNISSHSKIIDIIPSHPIAENITVVLELNKSEYYVGEPLSGSITIYNNNSIDVTLIDVRNPTSIGYGNYFTIRHTSKMLTYFPWDDGIDTPIEIKAGEIWKTDFEFRSYYGRLKSLPLDLPTGEYWVHSNFYYGNTTNYEILYSNNVYFEVSYVEISGIENISIELRLSKKEYYLGEDITGTVTVVNNNPYDFFLEDLVIERLLGHNFIIYNINTNADYTGSSNEALLSIEIGAFDEVMYDFSINRIYTSTNGSVLGESIQLEPGNYLIRTYLYYGNDTYKGFLDSNSEEFTVLGESAPPKGEETEYSVPMDLSGSVVAGSFAVVTIVVILTAAFIAATEIGRYGFFSALAPLYSKQRKKHTKEYYYNKGSVRGYVMGNPGESYNVIKRVLGMPNGTLASYLKALETEGEIKSERDGYLKRFYPADGRVTAEVLELTDVQKNIYSSIELNPGVSQIEISKQLDISLQRVNYNVQIMVDARLIKVEREGKRTKCYVIDDN